ncbi:sigma 54-interacting transcriptional regulator [Stieleria varia]|uniref:Nitrogen fixation protein VnfA n=1 Tax=Stieleria varia TaxID=2528005 RepID=A0A5C6AG98_9BACT|nr:sigma 54-interacting transcriptional regulator [Stieleria varia]TWT98480.1 Nitrogen fixation protein VnfA [Stieleria varia]
MVAYLAVTSGLEKGRHFALDPDRPMHIGRGSSCEIMLSDPVSSRFHAVVFREDDCWQIRDTGSRNGTLVNNQKIEHARLLDQVTITIGGTELMLIEPSSDSVDGDETYQTVVQDVFVKGQSVERELDPLTSLNDSGYLRELYLLSLELLRNEDPDGTIDVVLAQLRKMTSADAVGVSFDAGEGRYKPQRVNPKSSANTIRLSREMIRRVVKDGEAIWVNKHQDQDDTPSLGKWSDAIYVPLDAGKSRLGVLHLYRNEPSFDKLCFELAIVVARLLAVALVRAMKQDVLRNDHQRISQRNADTKDLIGLSAPMMRLKEKIVRVARASGSVLIRGESGCGKELVARAVHENSLRSMRPMLTVNCAAIPSELIESQLFGHKKGSFTGADADHDGWFQQAHTGTLFLDEIGELTLDGQAKLLRILEGHPFLPVGGTDQVSVDVRVIAATNRDLAEFVRERRFREDLFFRLSVFELLVPPLRQREDDLNLLIDHFLEHFRVQHGRSGLQLSDAARVRLQEYPWPGNVRQLRNVIDSAVVMADDPAIEAHDLGLRDTGLSSMDTLRIDEWERRLIRKALARTEGSVPEAAKLLGISRATAYRKLTEYDIPRD